jgi:hypothetical protein
MMDMANILLEETKKVAEINYRLSWAAADDYRPDLILTSVVSISEVRTTALLVHQQFNTRTHVRTHAGFGDCAEVEAPVGDWCFHPVVPVARVRPGDSPGQALFGRRLQSDAPLARL